MRTQEIELLKQFVTILKGNPTILHKPELAFFKDWLESMGATVPGAPEADSNGAEFAKGSGPEPAKKPPGSEEPKKPEAKPVSEDDEQSEDESDEGETISDLEVDREGCLDSKDSVDDTLEMGGDKEPTEEDMDAANEKRSAAQACLSEGDLDGAVTAFTEAIKLNPSMASLFAKRASALVKAEKLHLAIKDCNHAIDLNPDSAAPYKWRGRANRLLGNWSVAAKDFAMACKIDFDETTDEWLKEVKPKASRVDEHQRKMARIAEQKEYKRLVKEKKRRVKEYERLKREEAEERKAHAGMGGGMPGGMGGMPGGMGNLFSDPEMMQAMQDPEMMTALQDILQNPGNMSKYQDNPKIMNFMAKMTSKMGGAGGGGMPGGMPGMGGMPGGMGGMPGGMGGMPGSMPDLSSMFGGGAGAPPSSTGGTNDLD